MFTEGANLATRIRCYDLERGHLSKELRLRTLSPEARRIVRMFELNQTSDNMIVDLARDKAMAGRSCQEDLASARREFERLIREEIRPALEL